MNMLILSTVERKIENGQVYTMEYWVLNFSQVNPLPHDIHCLHFLSPYLSPCAHAPISGWNVIRPYILLDLLLPYYRSMSSCFIITWCSHVIKICRGDQLFEINNYDRYDMQNELMSKACENPSNQLNSWFSRSRPTCPSPRNINSHHVFKPDDLYFSIFLERNFFFWALYVARPHHCPMCPCPIIAQCAHALLSLNVLMPYHKKDVRRISSFVRN